MCTLFIIILSCSHYAFYDDSEKVVEYQSQEVTIMLVQRCMWNVILIIP